MKGKKAVRAFALALAVLLLAGCAGSITGYSGKEAEIGRVRYQISDRSKRAFAEVCFWDLDPTHRSFDIADTVEGAAVERLGGYIGVGVPYPFRIEPERGADCISSFDPSQESFDVPVTWQDLEFTICLGKELNEIARVTAVPYYGVKNPAGGIDFYRPVYRFVCDEGNRTFYSRDGVLYNRSDDAPVESLSALQEAKPSGSASPAPAADGLRLNGDELFTERELRQTADLTGAVSFTVADGEDISISEAGVYVLTGSAREVTVRVEAPKDAKVQLVLDGLHIENADAPCIYVQSGDKVFVTTAADSFLSTAGPFAEGDAVVWSKEDLVLNGEGKLTVASSENGVVSRDDLTVTGGSYEIQAGSKALVGRDSIRVAGGSFLLTAGTDGLHAENGSGDSPGWIYIGGGDFVLRVGDDAIHADSLAQFDGGSFDIAAAEGVEATYVQINGGSFFIRARGDGLNAGHKSSAYRPTIDITGGEIDIVAEPGDTDGIDANGDIIIRGGTVRITADSPFDYDGSAVFTGGTVIVNGAEVQELP